MPQRTRSGCPGAWLGRSADLLKEGGRTMPFLSDKFCGAALCNVTHFCGWMRKSPLSGALEARYCWFPNIVPVAGDWD